MPTRRNFKLLKILTVLLLAALAGVIGYYSYLDRNAIDSVPKPDFETRVELLNGHSPKICTGLEYPSVAESQSGYCPPHTALFVSDDYSTRRFDGSPASVPIDSVCCPLPAEDILTDEHVYNVEGECPSNHVITSRSNSQCGDKCFLRCTRINTERYRLGEKHQAVYWKKPKTYPSAGAGGAKQIYLTDVPLAIRYATGFAWYGIGQAALDELWDKDGCSSVPFGGMLVEKRKAGCGGLYSRSLFFRQGKAVRMYPECLEIQGVEQKNPHCIQ